MPDNKYFVSPEQLCVGLYIYLDMDWMEHSFTFNSFKIKDQTQIEALKQLGRESFRYEPNKSDCEPRTMPPKVMAKAVEIQAPVETPKASEADAVLENKKRLRAEWEKIRAEVVEVERKFKQAAASFRQIARDLRKDPKVAKQAVTELTHKMVTDMMASGDVALHAMSEGVGEDCYFHSLNVTVLSLIASKMLKLEEPLVEEIAIGALLHDLGKNEIPHKILALTRPLTASEQTLYQQHCAKGVELARQMALSPEALSVVAQHHECLDGTGYPAKLKGDSIAMAARIVSVANTYDNLCNPTNIAEALTPAEALSHMFALKRNKFDNAVLSTFVRSLGVYPPGSIVMLSNEMVGIVQSVNPAAPLRPNVLVYDRRVPKSDAVIVNLLQEPDVKISRSIRAQQLSREVMNYLSPRKNVTYFFNQRNAQASK